MTKLSPTARAILTTAADRDDRVALPPERLPAAARRAVVQSMLKAGLIEEVAADDDQPAWRTTERGERFALRVTDAGLSAVAVESAPHEAAQPAETANAAPQAAQPAEAAHDAPVAAEQASARLTLRACAQAVVAAWDEEGRLALPAALAPLRTALGEARGRPARTPAGTPRAPRTDTKQATVLALLRRPEGASGPQMVEGVNRRPKRALTQSRCRSRVRLYLGARGVRGEGQAERVHTSDA